MAFLDILNIPGLLGTELHTFKRANVYDKLDLGLAGVVALLAARAIARTIEPGQAGLALAAGMLAPALPCKRVGT